MDQSRSHFGKLKENITMTRSHLAQFFDTYVSLRTPLVDVRLALEAKLNDLLHKEQTFWRQCSKGFFVNVETCFHYLFIWVLVKDI